MTGRGDFRRGCGELIADGVLLIEAVSHQLSAISKKTFLAPES
jgi:hypothetical protein